jgi:hypothetical protein
MADTRAMRTPETVDWEALHIGRSWPGMEQYLEKECPCPTEPCGHVQRSKVDPDCPQHGLRQAKTIRSSHSPEACPASDLHGGRGEVGEGFDEETAYVERVTISDPAVVVAMVAEHLGVEPEEVGPPEKIYMRWVEDGNDPEVETAPVPDVPCWLECEPALHPNAAVPFWKVSP